MLRSADTLLWMERDQTTSSGPEGRFERTGDLRQTEQQYRRGIRRQPRSPRLHSLLGQVLLRQGRMDEALQSLQRAQKLGGNDAETSLAIGLVYDRLNQPRDAGRWVHQATEQDPTDLSAWVHLARMLQRRHQYAGTYRALNKALELKPDESNLHLQLGHTCFHLGRPEEAATHFRAVIKAKGETVNTLCFLGRALALNEHYDEAMKQYDRALEMDPDSTDAIAGHADVLAFRSESDAAITWLQAAIDRGVDSYNITSTYARLTSAAGDPRAADRQVRAFLTRPEVSGERRSTLLLFLGRLYEDRKAWDDAFTCYAEANAHAGAGFDCDRHREFIDGLIETFDQIRCAATPFVTKELTDRPIFIVGMPRSGTTLVEQILSAHAEIYGAGELPDVDLLARDLAQGATSGEAYPWCMKVAGPDQLKNVAARYLARLDALALTAARVTDKMPQNFLHLGLISMLFPKARVIHCVRHPMDTCFSCYTTGLSAAHRYTRRLEDLAFYYGEYRRLMDHWREAIRNPVLEVVYESMVTEPEAETKRLIEFVGLEWDDACLHPSESKRLVQTASRHQVAQPIYTSSKGRFENFREPLQPLRDGLAKWLDDMGDSGELGGV